MSEDRQFWLGAYVAWELVCLARDRLRDDSPMWAWELDQRDHGLVVSALERLDVAREAVWRLYEALDRRAGAPDLGAEGTGRTEVMGL